MKKNKSDRHFELATKLIQMGQALEKEGDEKNDYIISQLGTNLFFMAGLLMDEHDMYFFSELCNMFSAKKIIENLNQGDSPNIIGNNFPNINDFIKKIKRDNQKPDDNDTNPQ